MLVLNLQKNKLGNDYVIGDLHGRYDLFQRLLTHIKFDPSKDRMISVGDLIDRGPYSLDCLKLLLEPWFYCVRANHEEMFYNAFNCDDSRYSEMLGVSFFKNGGDWALPYFVNEDAEIKKLSQKVMELPLVINIETEDSHVHVLHAEIPPGEHVTIEDMRDEDQVNALYELDIDYTSGGIHGWLWGRTRFQFFSDLGTSDEVVERWKREVEAYRGKRYGSSEGLIISGHTKLDQPVRVDNFLNIDTSAYKTSAHYEMLDREYGLTCYNVNNGRICTVMNSWINPDVTPLTLRT